MIPVIVIVIAAVLLIGGLKLVDLGYRCPKSKTGKHCYHYKTINAEREHGYGIEKFTLQASQCCWCDGFIVPNNGAY